MGTSEVGQVRIRADARGERTSYEDLEVGKDLGSAVFFISQAEVELSCERMEYYHPWYSIGSPFGGTLVPIGLTYRLPRLLFSINYSVRGLLYKWSFEQAKPLLADTRYEMSARLSDKWVRNDREFVAYTAECRDSTGDVVFATRRAHVLDFIKRTAPKLGEGGRDSSDGRASNSPRRQILAEMAAAADTAVRNLTAKTVPPPAVIDVKPLGGRDTALGTALPSFAMPFTEARFAKHFSEGEFSTSLHFDREAARQEGLAAPVAGAPDVMALIHNSALQFFGKGWVTSGAADLTMIRPVYVGAFVTAKGFVKARELLADGRVRLVCETWVEDATGEKKVVGTASAIVR